MVNKELQEKLLALVQELKQYDDDAPAFVSTYDNCGGYVDVCFDKVEITRGVTDDRQVFIIFDD